MAGAGIKLFRNTEVLSADELNTYLMDQVVTVFDDATDRDNAFGSGEADPETNPSGDNKPVLSEGRLCYLRSTNAVQVYDGTQWQDSDQFTIGDGAVTEAKIATSAVTTDKINALAVTEGKIATSAVTVGKIANNAVSAAKINTSAIGSALNGGGGTAISVRTDGTTIQVNGSNNLEIVPGSTLQLTSSAPSSVGGTTGLTGNTVGVATAAARADHVHAATDTLSVTTITAPSALIVSNEFTLDSTYKDKFIILDNGATSLSVRIPTETDYPIGTQIHIQNHGTGTLTVSPVNSGATSLVCTPATGSNNAKLRARYSMVTLIKVASAGWTAVGDLTA